MGYIQLMNEQPWQEQGAYVLYWAHAAIRVRYNLALLQALELAREQQKRLCVVYQLVPQYPQANRRHFAFLLPGLAEFVDQLQKLGCDVEIICEQTNEQLLKKCELACAVVSDTSYLRYFREKQAFIAKQVPCQFYAVETNVVVPVQEAADKQAYSAGTFRPKITKQLSTYLQPMCDVKRLAKQHGSIRGMEWLDYQYFCETWGLATEVLPVASIGGEQAAQSQLSRFLHEGLAKYGQIATTFDESASSQLSAYLHFGHISPLDIALQVQNYPASQQTIDIFLEQLIVRRELAINFVYYCEKYDCYPEALPKWAQITLANHEHDHREYLYEYESFAQADTHDPIWNQAQKQLLVTGRMNNYMRMYWGKKVIEWTASYEQAWEYLLRLNDTYELDGRDPNGYVGVAWCFGLHDRAWAEREIFGKVRYMNETGIYKRQRAAKQKN